MSKEHRLAQLEKNPYLPTPPALAMQVLDKACKPECSIVELGRLISRDPALCSKVLRVANSALFGLPRGVASVDRALRFLGLQRVRALVLALSLPAMQRRVPNTQLRTFWRCSVTGAIVAREAAARLPGRDPENDLVAALLRDVGAVVLQQVFPQDYAKVLAVPLPTLLLRQLPLEEEHLGLHHAEVSAHLLTRWRLPEEMVQAIRYHHQPDEASAAHRQGAMVLAFATAVADLMLAPAEPDLLLRVLELARDGLGLREAELQKFLEPIGKQVADFGAILNVDLGPAEDQANLLSRSIEELARLAVETNLDNLRVRREKQQAEEGRDRAEAALQKVEEQLRQAQKLEAIGRLASGVAHDFNNLLTVITGFSEVLVTGMSAEDPLRSFASEIKQAGERGAALTRQLLAFSRKQLLMPIVLDANCVVRDMQKLLQRLIGERIQLITQAAAEACPVKADPGQLEQVIMNLAVNARDAMPGGGTLTISTARVELNEEDGCIGHDLRPGTYVQIALTDTGCGMDEEVQGHLFEPFFTTKERGKGTGLGLAMVYGIVRQSGGHITVRSRPDQGTTFTICLPLSGTTPSMPEIPLPPTSTRAGNETVLLVEDEVPVRTITRQILSTHGYAVLEAGQSDDALRLCREHKGHIDLLLTDVGLPRMDGCELADAMHALRPDLRVVYMSGYLDEAMERLGESPHPHLIQKPFGAQALIAKVREALDQPRLPAPA